MPDDATSLPGTEGRVGHLSNIGLAYRERYLLYGYPADLDLAVHYTEEALAADPDDEAGRAVALHNLGITYWIGPIALATAQTSTSRSMPLSARPRRLGTRCGRAGWTSSPRSARLPHAAWTPGCPPQPLTEPDLPD